MTITGKPKKITIDVTSEDIERGSDSSCFFCPIALAARRVLKTTNVEVFRKRIEINDRAYRLPLVARMFIVAFDSRKIELIKPFTFELEAA